MRRRYSDAALRLVLQSCRSLNELKMAGCSAPMGYVLVKHCPCVGSQAALTDPHPRLQPNHHDRHMFLLPSLPGTLAVNISSVIVLDLSRCIHVDDSAVTWMLDSCSNLRRLSLSGCVRVSDNGIARLAAAQPQLRAIDVSGCPKLTRYVSLLGVHSESALDSTPPPPPPPSVHRGSSSSKT